MMLAGLPVPDDAVDGLAELVRTSGADDLADRLERALAEQVKLLALTLDERALMLVALDDPPQELFEDSDIAQQIGAVFADSKAAEEARVFTLGVATANEPIGLVTALVAAGGSTVIATGTNVLAQADLYANQAALPARWRPNAKFMMNLTTMNGYRQLPQATGLNYSMTTGRPRRRSAGKSAKTRTWTAPSPAPPPTTSS